MRIVLVIKLGALGDFVHAFHAFAAIRAAHRTDRVVLLTTAPFEALARRSPWFDAVEVDERAAWWRLGALARTRRVIRAADFVYDLQTSRRSGRYFRLAGRPAWSGIARGCSHPHDNERRDFMHTIERQREQLERAGVAVFPVPERDWFGAEPPALPAPYVLLVPGGAGVGSVKRWALERYVALARRISARGLMPVVIGGAAERGLGEAIAVGCPEAMDLTGRTSIEELAAIARGARLAVGNDTGPLHVAACVGAPTIALFSAASVADQAAPRGPAGEWATVLQAGDLGTLTVERVDAAVAHALASG